MPEVKIEDLGEKNDPRTNLEPDEAAVVKGGATLEKLSDGKTEGSTLKGTIKGFGSTTGEGPGTF